MSKRDGLRLLRCDQEAAMKRLAGFLWPYRARIAIALIALLVAVGCVLALGRGLQHVVDRGFGSGEPRLLDQALSAMIAVVVLFAAATYARFYFMMTVGERVVTDLRRAVFDHILSLDPSFFEKERTGDVVSRLTNDATLLQQVIGYGVSMFVRNALMMVGAALMLFVTSWKLAASRARGRAGHAAADPAPRPPGAAAVALEPGPRRRGRGVRRRSGARDPHRACVRARGPGPRRFARHAEAAYAAAARISQKAFLIAAVILIAFSAVGIILWIGGHDVFAGRMSQGELAAFVFYAAVVAAGAGTVAEVWGELQRAAGATERLVELLETRPGIVAPASPATAPQRAALDIEFDAVRFAYPARPRSRRSSFSLRIAPGRARRAGRSLRRGQVDGVRASPAVLRPAAGRGAHRRRRRSPRWTRARRAAWSRWCRRSR